MNIEKWLKSATMIGALVFAPAVAVAAAAPSESQEATHLLNDMRQDARGVADHATVLGDFAVSPDVYWEAHAIELRRIKSEVDDMGKRLNRLEAMQSDVAPWQQQAIQQAAPLVQFMADNTTDAINYMNAHQGGLWSGPYRQDVRRLDTEANTLVKNTHRPEALSGD